MKLTSSDWFGLVALAVVTSGAAACADDPVYLKPGMGVAGAPSAIEVDPNNMTPGPTMLAITVPVEYLPMRDDPKRMKIATDLMLDPALVANARRDDMDVSIEWTIKNLDDAEGTGTVTVNGANEFFHYNPEAFVIDPQEDEPAPPLMGGIPIIVPALGQVSGVFREDQVSEAAMDLDAITRWGVTPEAATLTRWPTGDIAMTPMLTPTMSFPSAAIPALISIEVNFAANRHMVLEYVVRVRDHSDRLVPNAITDMTPTVMVSTTDFVPPPPPAP